MAALRISALLTHHRRSFTSSISLLSPWTKSHLRRGIFQYSSAAATEEAVKSPVDVNYSQLLINGQFVDAVSDGGGAEFQSKGIDESPVFLSHVRFGFGPAVGPFDMIKHIYLQRTPKTPTAEDYEFESRLESLPMDYCMGSRTSTSQSL